MIFIGLFRMIITNLILEMYDKRIWSRKFHVYK